MKKMFILLALMAIILLGCSEERSRDNSETTDIDSRLYKNENDKIPFKIEEIESKIVSLDDAASDTPITGVTYQLLLFSNEKIPPESYSSYEFSIVTNSTLKESLGPFHPLNLANTINNGYLYRIQFESIYRDNYTQEELENLKNYRDFQIFVNHRGERYPVEY
ncbi:hypothetical protein [Peribacillus loiseleuriae]|uniref:hypothetical protein n=1 Tax=Peribacillus loiseleuriae TaxID=1679170 RepID=UPI003CFEA443